MENGLLVKTEEDSPQRGPLSLLLANVYLNEYDQEMTRQGVPIIRYADDIVVLAKSARTAQRLLESTRRYLEGKLKLKMNVEKSKVVSVHGIRNFKFLGFALGKGRNGVYICAHAGSLRKVKAKLKERKRRIGLERAVGEAVHQAVLQAVMHTVVIPHSGVGVGVGVDKTGRVMAAVIPIPRGLHGLDRLDSPERGLDADFVLGLGERIGVISVVLGLYRMPFRSVTVTSFTS